MIDFHFPDNLSLPAYGEVCVWIGEEVPQPKEGNELTVHLTWDNVVPEDLVRPLES